MGGELAACGCFDGVPHEDWKGTVAIRCEEHKDVPAKFADAYVISRADWDQPRRRGALRKGRGRMAASIKARR